MLFLLCMKDFVVGKLVHVLSNVEVACLNYIMNLINHQGFNMAELIQVGSSHFQPISTFI